MTVRISSLPSLSLHFHIYNMIKMHFPLKEFIVRRGYVFIRLESQAVIISVLRCGKGLAFLAYCSNSPAEDAAAIISLR